MYLNFKKKIKSILISRNTQSKEMQARSMEQEGIQNSCFSQRHIQQPGEMKIKKFYLAI